MSATVIDLRTGVDKDAVAIGNLCSKARGSIVDSVKYLIEAGQKLIAKKKSLAHGEWMSWLKENKDALGFGIDAANRLMKCARTNSEPALNLTEAEATQISKSVWGHTKSKRKLRKHPVRDRAREILRPKIIAGEPVSTLKTSKDHGISHVVMEQAAIVEYERLKLLDELGVDPETLALSAKAKLKAAIQQVELRLNMQYAERMRNLDEEVRQRVLEEGKEYLKDLQEMRDKASHTEQCFQEMINNHKPILTIDQFNLIRKCLHQGGVAATPRDFDAAFDLIQKRKLQLTGKE